VAESGVDVSIERKEEPRPDEGRRHPNTCPSCGSHYRDDELKAALRVCRQCGHHFPMPAEERIASLADPGSFEEEAEEVRSADPLEFFDLRPYREPSSRRASVRRSSSAARRSTGSPASCR
jgi:acetyl-CoA carboxylase beta subunit